MQALPITTPSVVKIARSLFDHSSSSATRQVSRGSILHLRCKQQSPAFTFFAVLSVPRRPAYCGDRVSEWLDIPAQPDPTLLLFHTAWPAIGAPLNEREH